MLGSPVHYDSPTRDDAFALRNIRRHVTSNTCSRSYGSTTVSGSGPAHLGDINFNAPLHIDKLVLSDERHIRAYSQSVSPDTQDPRHASVLDIEEVDMLSNNAKHQSVNAQ